MGERERERQNGKRTKRKRIKNEVDIGAEKTVSPRSRGIFKLPIFRCSRPPPANPDQDKEDDPKLSLTH